MKPMNDYAYNDYIPVKEPKRNIDDSVLDKQIEDITKRLTLKIFKYTDHLDKFAKNIELTKNRNDFFASKMCSHSLFELNYNLFINPETKRHFDEIERIFEKCDEKLNNIINYVDINCKK